MGRAQTFWVAHVLIGKPGPTFPGHALVTVWARAAHRHGHPEMKWPMIESTMPDDSNITPQTCHAPAEGASGGERKSPLATRRPLSYAQNMEDYHLHVAFAGVQQGRYIDIGGGHPVAGSVSFWFYQRGWSGIV